MSHPNCFDEIIETNYHLNQVIGTSFITLDFRPCSTPPLTAWLIMGFRSAMILLNPELAMAISHGYSGRGTKPANQVCKAIGVQVFSSRPFFLSFLYYSHVYK